MKKFLALILFITAGCLTITEAAETPWLTDLSRAETAAKQEGKPILMLFTGSDWCPYCVQMEENVYSTPEFQQFSKEKLILLMLDFPSSKQLPANTAAQNRALAQKFNVRGFPTCILVSPGGKELCRISGARPLKPFLAELNNAVSQMKR